MASQFVSSLYANNLNTFEKMNPNNMTAYDLICQRYYNIEKDSQWAQDQVNPVQDDEFKFIGSDEKYTVAVVDFCDDSQADIDLDGDNVADMAHGNVVAHLIESSFKNSDVYTFDITETSEYSTNERMLASLAYIIEEIETGECDYDAVNLSLSSRISYAQLSKELGITINNSNVENYVKEIKHWLKCHGEERGYGSTAQVVEMLEIIEELGVDVYIAAANVNDGTDDELNLYTLAASTTTAGALDKEGDIADFSFNNSLIDAWALGEIEVKKLRDYVGNLIGFDLNDDGEVDIDASYSSSGGAFIANPFLKGTSFASPYLLMHDLS